MSISPVAVVILSMFGAFIYFAVKYLGSNSDNPLEDTQAENQLWELLYRVNGEVQSQDILAPTYEKATEAAHEYLENMRRMFPDSTILYAALTRKQPYNAESSS